MRRTPAITPKRLGGAALCLLLGVVTTFAIALALAQPGWSALVASAWKYNGYYYYERSDVRMEWQSSRAAGRSRTEVVAASRAEPVLDDTARAEQLPPDIRRLRLREGDSAVVKAAGWPARSFRHGDLARKGAGLVLWGAWHFGWQDPSTFPPTTREIVIPYAPEWDGIAFDTLFYAVLWWAGFASVRLVQRSRHLRRGLCPMCRYDLKADFSGGCPECGWRRW